jgi:MarR-like DNA-binding transcriptional regulator SgrR of sgrS sRNA
MKPIGYRLLALISGVLLFGVTVRSATSPRRGGTLRVELRASSVSLDPREWMAGTVETATDEKLAALVFDRLVVLDNYGRFQPQLATEWTHDAAFKRWQFALRAGVKFSDGSVLTAADVATALQALLPSGQQITATGSSVVIQSALAMPDLLEEVASGRFFVYRVQADGTLLGTGPLFVSESRESLKSADKSDSATAETSNTPLARGEGKPMRLRFRANEETWSGRPFLDAIDVTLGVPPLRQLFDLQLGKADLVEISPDLMRRATQDNLRVWTSAPVVLYGLRFDEAQAAAVGAQLREAVSLSLDRQTMANVLLQKQAEPAAALLPQWLSGYAFLFTMETNIARAREIRAALPANAAGGREPLRLRVDAPGDLPKLLGERVAINARQAAIPVQVVSRTALHNASTTASSADAAAGLHLFAWHYSTLSSRLELESFVSALHLGDSSEGVVSSTDPEQLYAREKRLLDERHVLPLVALPEYVGLGQNVRDWMPARWGEWHLADVWIDSPEPAQAQAGNANAAGSPANPPAAALPGAKP